MNVSPQFQLLNIATRLKPGLHVRVPIQLIADATRDDFESALDRLLARVDREDMESFLQKVSHNWSFKYYWEAIENVLVMFHPVTLGHYKLKPMEPLALCGALAPIDDTAEMVWVEEEPLEFITYEYRP